MFILDFEYLHHFLKLIWFFFSHAGTFIQHFLFHLVVGNKIQRQKKSYQYSQNWSIYDMIAMGLSK